MNFINSAIQEYCEKHSSMEEEVLNSVYRDTYLKQINPRMVSGHLQGKFLQLLVSLLKPAHILEIGTYTGYSAISLALASGKEAKIHTIEVDPELKPTIDSNISQANLKDKINVYYGNALEIVPEIIGKHQIDMVFIDADKNNYPNYFNLLKDVLPKGGLLVADNVLWSGKVIDQKERDNDDDTAAIHIFNELLVNDPTFEVLMLPVRDGMSIARKK